METKELPPLEFLKEHLELDSESPSGLRWRERPKEYYISEKLYNNFLKNRSGKAAGFKRYKGRSYYSVALTYNKKQKNYSAHRIVYSLYHNINISKDFFIDHIDRDSSNNNAKNLRLVSPMGNSINRSVSIINKSGVTGVSLKKNLKWNAFIVSHGKSYHLGCFTKFEDAVKIRKYAEKLREESNNFDFAESKIRETWKSFNLD